MSNEKTVYDLKERSRAFAAQCRKFVQSLPRSMANQVDGRQLLKASGSVGANYLEADNALGDKDFLMRIGICLKEARESEYWLSLIEPQGQVVARQREGLLQVSRELVKIFAAIARKKRSRL